MARTSAARKAATRVKRRRVFYIHGFDPRGPAAYHAMFVEEAARVSALTGRAIEAGPRQRRDSVAARWDVSAGKGADKVETDYVFLRWDDLVRARWSKSEILLLGELWLWLWMWGRVGFMGRAAKQARALLYAMMSTPVVTLLYLLSAMAVVGVLGFFAGVIAHSAGLPYWLGMIPALLSLFLAPGVWRRLEAKLNVCWLSRCFTYMRRRHLGQLADLQARDAAFAATIAEAAADPKIDEVLVVGHSLGALAAISALARAIQANKGFGADGRVALLTLGQPVAIHTAVKGDADFVADLQTLADTPRIAWLDVTSPSDPASACALPPLTDVSAPKDRLVQRSPRFHVYLDPARFRIIRRNPLDFHFEYLKTPDLDGGFDYFAFVGGRERMADQPWLKAAGK